MHLYTHNVTGRLLGAGVVEMNRCLLEKIKLREPDCLFLIQIKLNKIDKYPY